MSECEQMTFAEIGEVIGVSGLKYHLAMIMRLSGTGSLSDAYPFGQTYQFNSSHNLSIIYAYCKTL